ncbi:MAG TPA: anti-sigma factor [Candidatus Eremiobacteraceae bacterium]|nr:anti-sigma factor [Candidatus Eremiobacteraceae bacterium]
MRNAEHIPLDELELLALGALPEEEEEPVQEHVAECQECARKLAVARGHVSLLAFAVKQEHPAGTVKAELMARIRVSRETEEQYAWPAKTQEPPAAKSRESRHEARSGWLNWVLVIAAITLGLISFALSWQNRRIAAELQRQRKAAESLVHDREQIEKFVSVLAAADTVTIQMSGMGNTPNASGVVKFNAKAGVVLFGADLRPLPRDKSYQMWLVTTNGAPIGVGLLGPGGHAWGNMWTGEVPGNTQAQGFEVTIEPVGGAPRPTGPKVLAGIM